MNTKFSTLSVASLVVALLGGPAFGNFPGCDALAVTPTSRATEWPATVIPVAIAPSGTGASHEYVWLGDRMVTEFSGASTFSAFTDHLATPTILTNSSGAVVWQADFEPFGKVYALRTADMHQPIRRLGQIATQFDDGAGPDGDSMLEYNHARWYNPAWGPYTQPEPLSAMGQTEPYAYVEDDPYSKTDQTGNCYVQAFYDEPNVYGVQSPGLFHETIVVSPSNYAGDIPITRDSQGRTVVPAFFAGTPNSKWNMFVDVDAWASPIREYLNYEMSNGGQSPELIKQVADDEDCFKTCAKLSKVAKDFSGDNISYNPFGTGITATPYFYHWVVYANSNTFAYAATQALGVAPETAPHPLLPGYGPLPKLPK